MFKINFVLKRFSHLLIFKSNQTLKVLIKKNENADINNNKKQLNFYCLTFLKI